jgi:hypothetical protein
MRSQYQGSIDPTLIKFHACATCIARVAESGVWSYDAQHADGGEQRVGHHVMHEQGFVMDISDREAGQCA